MKSQRAFLVPCQHKRRSREGAWIEILTPALSCFITHVAPARERGLKSDWVNLKVMLSCRSREGAWIEISTVTPPSAPGVRRSREGAWIEISRTDYVLAVQRSRSREGAWIEIQMDKGKADGTPGRSREGAWIEICKYETKLAGAVCRSREGAWIEMSLSASPATFGTVAPARERGLKSRSLLAALLSLVSLPRGSVD